jgi:hypothetical protein
LPEKTELRGWPESIRRFGDFNVGLYDISNIVGSALDELMQFAPLPDHLVPRFAQGLLPNEDPWILRQTPMPDSAREAWPSGKDLDNYHTRPETGKMRNRLLLFACGHRLPDDECVLAARVQVFSSREDFSLWIWWEDDTRGLYEVRSSGRPTTVSARTFTWWLGDWWEPPYFEDRHPLTFVPGGSQRLAHSFVELFPARRWITEFGWRPMSGNPLVWLANNRPIARYERLHGELRHTNSHHYRQPLLDRWVVKKAIWEDLEDRFGPFRLRDDFERADCNV